jgi:hypothetical protein
MALLVFQSQPMENVMQVTLTNYKLITVESLQPILDIETHYMLLISPRYNIAATLRTFTLGYENVYVHWNIINIMNRMNQ